ncbi:MAG: lysophospholipid acyltransferase family protein [Dehalococcoidia bacterium]
MIERLVPFMHPVLKFTLGMPLRYLLFRLKVRGLENVPDVGGAIVVANHLSNFDPGVVGTSIKRRIRFMAKEELFFPGFGLLLRLHGVFPIRRLEKDTAAVRRATQLLKDGEVLGMFPEGTRSKEGKLQHGRPGTAFIALRAGVPIVPAAITGTEELKSWKATLFSRARLSITYGKPFYLERPPRVTAQTLEEATDAIMRAIAELLPEQYRGVYASENVPPQTTPPSADDPTPSLPLLDKERASRSGGEVVASATEEQDS